VKFGVPGDIQSFEEGPGITIGIEEFSR